MAITRNTPLFPAIAVAMGTALASGCATATAQVSDRSGEALLAEMLAGRTAGEPQSCISALVDRNLQVIDETALVYDGGDTIWVARPDNPRSLDSDDVLIVERAGGRLCKQDVVRTVDRTLGFSTGVVFLADFVPYR